MAQLMPLTVSCFSKIQIGFTFLVPAHPGSPRKRAFKLVCVCVRACVRACMCFVAVSFYALIGRSLVRKTYFQLSPKVIFWQVSWSTHFTLPAKAVEWLVCEIAAGIVNSADGTPVVVEPSAGSGDSVSSV